MCRQAGAVCGTEQQTVRPTAAAAAAAAAAGSGAGCRQTVIIIVVVVVASNVVDDFSATLSTRRPTTRLQSADTQRQRHAITTGRVRHRHIALSRATAQA